MCVPECSDCFGKFCRNLCLRAVHIVQDNVFRSTLTTDLTCFPQTTVLDNFTHFVFEDSPVTNISLTDFLEGMSYTLTCPGLPPINSWNINRSLYKFSVQYTMRRKTSGKSKITWWLFQPCLLCWITEVYINYFEIMCWMDDIWPGALGRGRELGNSN